MTHIYNIKTAFALLFSAMLSIGIANAQTTQKIAVKEYKGKQQKTAIPQVGVTVTNAGATITDANGEASLRFRSLQAGDKVEVRRIEKQGYEVFNQDALDQWTISSTNAFVIVLCKSDNFKQLKDNYMRASSASYERQYKKDQDKLDAERKAGKLKQEEFEQKMQELEDEYYEQLENLENYVDQFSRIDLSEISSVEQEIIDLVQQGKMDEAVALYEKNDFLGRYEKETADIRKIDQATQRLQEVEAQKRQERSEILASINRQIATYRLAGGRENFKKISALMKGMADADLTNNDAVMPYINHLRQQKEYEECKKYITICADNNKSDIDIQCWCHSKLSQCQIEEGDFDACEQSLLKIAELRKNDEPSGSQYLGLLAKAQQELASFYVNIGNTEMAKEWIAPAISNYEKLYSDPDDGSLYWGGLSQLYGSQAIIYLEEENADGAEKYAIKAYDVVHGRTLTDDIDGQYYDMTLNYAQQVFYTLERWTDMEKYLLEEIVFLEERFKNNPDSYIDKLEGACSNASELYSNMEQYDKAEQYFKKADALLMQMESDQGSECWYQRFCLYDAAAHLYESMQQSEDARKFAKLALQAFDKLEPEESNGFEENAESLRNFFNENENEN